MVEDNKKEIALNMLEKALGSIDFSRVAAIHLAFKLNSKDTDDNTEDTNDPEEVTNMNNNMDKACADCGNNKDNCKCA